MRNLLVYVVDSLIVLLCIAGFYQVYEKAGLPVVFRQSSLVIEEVNRPSFLRTGDRLAAIDGIPVASADEVEFILDSKPIGQPVLLGIDRGGIAANEEETLVHFFSFRYIVIQIIAASVFIYLGVFVFTRRKEDRAARTFNWAVVCSALIIAATWGRFTIAPGGAGYIVRAAFHLAYALGGVLFLHFTLVFPSVQYGRAIRWLGILYAAAAATAAAATWCFFDAARDLNMEAFRTYNTVFNGIRLYFAACVLSGLAVIARTYVTARDESERRKLRWIMLGLTVGPLCYVALWVIPQVITSRGLVDEEYVVLAMLAVPATFAVSIVKYHILNIDQIFKRTTVYAMVLFAILAIYAAVVSISPLVIGMAGGASAPLGISIVAAAIIAALFQPIRLWTQRFVDRKFFRVRYSYRAAEKRFIEEIILCYDESSISRTVTDAVDRLLPNAGTQLCLLSDRDAAHPGEVIAHFRDSAAPLVLPGSLELGATCTAADPAVFERLGAAAAFRIHSEPNGMLGCLLLGPKRSGFPYTVEDVDLLESFCHQAALALDRVNLQRSLISEQMEKNRLRELSELKSYFVSSVTHELKTPLTSIRMFTELIETSPRLRREKREEYVQIIKSESERLSRLIDNVLDLSKIEKGMKEYRFAPVELNACVHDAMNTMQFQFGLHGFDVRTRLARRKLMICADRDAVLEVLINLLTNAIKYASQKKKIIVSTSLTDDGAQLQVEDCGIGIGRDDLQRIFEPFERTEPGRLLHTSGTGLGLALVKHIADAHKAPLSVESEPGRGSAFSITFPLLAQEETA